MTEQNDQTVFLDKRKEAVVIVHVQPMCTVLSRESLTFPFFKVDKIFAEQRDNG